MNNFYNGNTSESINATLNKYINSTNIIRDNLYIQTPMRNVMDGTESGMKNSKMSNKNIFQNSFKDSDKLSVLNKYKIPSKK